MPPPTGTQKAAVRDSAQDAPAPSAEAVRNPSLLREVWKFTALYMAALRQYGDHPNATRAIETAFQVVGRALEADPKGPRWEVTPFGFVIGGETIWEPDKPPFDRIPYRLFADGLRTIAIAPGVTQQEYADFIRLVLEVEAGLAGDDDAASALWARHFEHLSFVTVDAFAEGDAQARQAFQNQCDEVARQAQKVAGEDRAGQRASTIRATAVAARHVAIGAADRSDLQAQIAEGPERWLERFVPVFAAGYQEAAAHGDLSSMTEALQEWSHNRVLLRSHEQLFGMFDKLCLVLPARVAASERASIPEKLAALMISPDDLREILLHLERQADAADGFAGSAAAVAAVIQGVARVLELAATDAFFDPVSRCFQAVPNKQVRDALGVYVTRWMKGHEAAFAEKLSVADAAFALTILRMVVANPTAASQVVIDAALSSPHREVRMEALAEMVKSGASDGIVVHVERMLADPEFAVRRELLRLVVRLALVACVPAIVRRVQASDFHEIPIAERREWLTALVRLEPARAEVLLIAIVTGKKIIPSDPIEQTRAVAVDLLGSFGSEAALKAAQAASSKWWWNTEPVREAASRAAAAIASKLATPPAEGGAR